MAGVNRRDHRSIIRPDSSIRSSSKITRVGDSSIVEDPVDDNISRPSITTASLPPPSETHPIPENSPKQRITRPVPPPNPSTSGPGSRLRPIQNTITAVNAMKDNSKSTRSIISRILHPKKEETSLIMEQNVSVKDDKIEELTKMIKILEEKVSNRNDTLLEMWKLRDEIVTMKKLINTQGDTLPKKTSTVDDLLLNKKLDEIITQLKKYVDVSLEKNKEVLETLNSKTSSIERRINEREETLNSALETLASHVSSLGKKIDVAETRISMLDGKIRNDLRRTDERFTSLETNFSTIQKSLETLNNSMRDIRNKNSEMERLSLEKIKHLEESLLLMKKYTESLKSGAPVDNELLKKQIIEKIKVDETKLRKEIADSLKVDETKLRKEIADSLKVDEAKLRKEIADSLKVDETKLRKEIVDSLKVDETKLRKEIVDSLKVDETKLRKEIVDSLKVDETKLRKEIVDSLKVDETKLRKEIADSLKVDETKLRKEIEDLTKINPRPNEIGKTSLVDIEKIKKEILDDTASRITSAVLKIQTERSDREREILREQKDLLDLISKTELKVMTELKKVPATTNDKTLQTKIETLDGELKILREKVGDVHTERRSRSNPRTRPQNSRDLDPHRLAEFPLFVAELYNEQIIVGESGLHNLVVPKHWEIITDTDKGYEPTGGIYKVPFPGCYDINVLFKTISTSVTAQINVEHLNADGKIIKSFALDQSSLVNDSAGTLKFLNMNGGDGIRFRIQTRFNLALMERQTVEETLPDGTKSTHHVVFNMVQIAYSPVRGFCEC